MVDHACASLLYSTTLLVYSTIIIIVLHYIHLGLGLGVDCSENVCGY